MFRLAWATDIHLNFLRHPDGPGMFGHYLIQENEADALLVTGDISEAPTLERHLEQLESGLGDAPLYFVLGNHDYYGGSFEDAREIANTFEGWLDERGPRELAPNVALVGSEGWYDAYCGLPFANKLVMSDWGAIHEIREAIRAAIPGPGETVEQVAKRAIVRVCRERSHALAEAAREPLKQALEKYEWVIFATHYPPFEGACWHEGHVSDDIWRPWFTSKLTGDLLLEAAQAHPDRKIIVLCGHTHSSGTYMALPNLLVLTGEAVYGAPDLAGLLVIDETGVYVRLKLNKYFVDIAPFAPSR